MDNRDHILEISWGPDGPALELDLKSRAICCLPSDRKPWRSTLCQTDPDPSFRAYVKLLAFLSLERCDLPSHRPLTFTLPRPIRVRDFRVEIEQVCYYARYLLNHYPGLWKECKGFLYRRSPTDTFIFDWTCNFRGFYRRRSRGGRAGC